jgi:hypothetical protein
MDTAKLNKLDRIILSHDSIRRVSDWCGQLGGFEIGKLPFNEGVLEVQDKEVPTLLHFKHEDNRIVFMVYILPEDENPVDVGRFYVDGKEGLQLDQTYYKSGIVSKFRNIAEEAKKSAEYFAAVWAATITYMNTFKAETAQVSVEARRVKVEKKARKGKVGKRVTYISRKTYIVNVPEGLPKRQIERHTESWPVRGHPRTYKKTGKTIWIEPYTKGDKNAPRDPKTYKV